MDPLFEILEDLAALSAAELQEYIDGTVAHLDEIADDPTSFITEGRDSAQLRAEMAAAVAAVKSAREHLASFEAEPEAEAAAEPEAEADEPEADEPEAEEVDEALAADVAQLAAEAHVVPEVEAEVEVVTAAAAAPAAPRRTRPARSRQAAPQDSQPLVALTAAAGATDVPLGHQFGDPREVADAMIRRHRNFTGLVPEGVRENYAIARADWRDMYPEERTLAGKDPILQAGLVAAAIDERVIQANFEARRKADPGSLTASGGLCAPVTPYYGLQMLSQAMRPVRAALPSFNADRGGINAAAPASLADITTGVGQMTADEDAAGGTAGTKTCQVVDCPQFSETEIEVLYHCLQFGNLGARTFPELVAQWNSLVLAAHARMGDRSLLTGIGNASTAVTAASLGLGAAADLLGEVLVAAAGMRSRHRMDPKAVLRVMLPDWVLALLVSDTYRSTFGRFDMTPEKFVTLLRAGNVEPTFYIDSASGAGQEFGAQSAGALLAFPSTVVWYLYPEGSFLYLDGGTLELGLVRDSILNSTNDFQIFGESFENVAFIGIESLEVTSTLCDNGVTGGTHNNPCPISYTETS